MKTNFKRRFKKTAIWLSFVFILLFLFRLVYGYHKTSNNNFEDSVVQFESISYSNRNYATKKYKIKPKDIHTSSAAVVDQKYEKIASINTQSSEFEKEEKLTRAKIRQFGSLIQFEQKSGNRGNRKLSLSIGVPPENFDSLYSHLTRIGRVESKRITKTDKTNEYKELKAKKQSLEKIRASLIELKNKGGKIAEYIDLENRILNIEQQLQGLGVSLGDFDDENEFCTVQFSLSEGKQVEISFIHRVKVALEWTVKMYLRLMVSAFFLTFLAYMLLLSAEKLKVLERIIGKRDE